MQPVVIESGSISLLVQIVQYIQGDCFSSVPVSVTQINSPRQPQESDRAEWFTDSLEVEARKE